MSKAVKQRVPKFHSVDEEAEFWASHDTTDYELEWESVKVRLAKNLSQGITIRFSPSTLAQLPQTAHHQGVAPTTLARIWVLERLRREYSSTATDSDWEPLAAAVTAPPLGELVSLRPASPTLRGGSSGGSPSLQYAAELTVSQSFRTKNRRAT